MDTVAPAPAATRVEAPRRAALTVAAPRGARRGAAVARVLRLALTREPHAASPAQEEIRKEAQTMSLLNHPNLVSCYCSFVNGPVRSARLRDMRARPV